jgi:hypothetical protein
LPKPLPKLKKPVRMRVQGEDAPMRLGLLPACLMLSMLAGAAPPVSFVPQQPRFAESAKDYRQLWASEGARMVAALEARSGLRFPSNPVEAIIRDGPPMADFEGRWMRLRATRSPDYRRATLMHELGHLLARSLPRSDAIDDHRLLFLFLYDAWADLYGRDFAERFMRSERRISSAYDYDAAWRWALAMSQEQRQARLRSLRRAALAAR